jgi:predicted secreted protein
MKNLLILAFFMAVTILNVQASGVANKDVVGNWKYEVAGAPYGYEKGTLVFAEKEGKLVGEVKFDDGYKIEMKEVKLEEGGVVKCGLYVDYEYISVSVKLEGTKMTGSVNTPDGELKLKAEKVK